MKNIYIIISLLVLVLFSCTDVNLADQGIVLQNLSGRYIAFNQSGQTVTAVVMDIEEGESAMFELEAPIGVLVDVTVSFTFSGTATYGTDFTVTGTTTTANASGGSVVLSHDPMDINNFDRVSFTINALTDGVKDGEKDAVITLTSAIGSDGSIYSVGRGGTDFLKTATTNIADVN